MAVNQAALSSLSPAQQKAVTAALPKAAGQRTDAQKKAMDAYRAAVKSLGTTGGAASTALPGSTGGGPPKAPFMGYGADVVKDPRYSQHQNALLDYYQGLTGVTDEELPLLLSFGALNNTLTGEFSALGGSRIDFSDPHQLQRAAAAMKMLSTNPSLLAQARAGIPEWAPEAYSNLQEQGVPWSTELLYNLAPVNGRAGNRPGAVNYNDPSQPLFNLGTDPVSLFQLTNFQAGESAHYASMTAQQLLEQIWPLYHANYNRPAGAPSPTGGLMFGDIGYDESKMGQLGGGVIKPKTRETEVYQQWGDYGMPGDPTMGGWIRDHMGFGINPITGETQLGKPMDPLGQAILSGQLKPEHLYPFVPDWHAHLDLLYGTLGRVGTAAFLNDWSLMERGSLDPATQQRYMAMLQQAGMRSSAPSYQNMNTGGG